MINSNSDLGLPFKDVPQRAKLIIHKTLSNAWKELLDRDKKNQLSTALEPQITEALFVIICEFWNKSRIPGFDEYLFGSPQSGPNIRNYNGEKLEKEIDIRIPSYRLASGRDPYNGIFIECKPVDKKHSIKRDYYEEGIKRFLDGDYAWAIPSAMMIGYAREGRKLKDNFIPYILENRTQLFLVEHTAPSEKFFDGSICETIHDRKFILPDHSNKVGKISIQHHWLQLNKIQQI